MVVYQYVHIELLNQLTLPGMKRAYLIGSFQELAKYFGKKIIDKYHVSFAKRESDGTIFVPETLQYGDILFNFAANYEQDDAEAVWSQEKKTTHEIRSINAINSAGSGIHTALMCVLDYKGFRMVAYASMPLDEQVLSMVRFGDLSYTLDRTPWFWT